MKVRFPLIAVCLSVTAIASAQELPRVENAPPDAASAVSAPAAAAPAVVTAPVARDTRGFDASNEYRIGPEDLLDVQVWKNSDLSRTVPVRPDGRISLPLVNDIQAAGLTPAELRMQITQKLAEFVPSAEVSVMVREVHSVKVSVIGAVKMPGNYEVKSSATVLDLLARAQGLTEFAKSDNIIVQRREGTSTKSIPFNYRKAAEGKQENFDVRPGDVIFVP